MKSAKTQGIRTGNWLSQRQAQALLSAPDITTLRGLRDRAILAVLLGCGLRRSEVAALRFTHLQQRDGRWCIVDLVGKHGRVRTAPMPTWVKVAIGAWTLPAGVADGRVFRSVNRADRVTSDGLGEKVVWQRIKPYAEAAGVPGIAPHDLRRYAESRTMPNRYGWGHTRKGLDIARCGIVLITPLLRGGSRARSDRTAPFQERPNTYCETLAGSQGDRVGGTGQTAADSVRCTLAESSDRRTMPHHSRGQHPSAAIQQGSGRCGRILIRHSPGFGMAASLNRFNSCWATLPFRRRNATSARSRIWSTRPTTRSS